MIVDNLGGVQQMLSTLKSKAVEWEEAQVSKRPKLAPPSDGPMQDANAAQSEGREVINVPGSPLQVPSGSTALGAFR